MLAASRTLDVVLSALFPWAHWWRQWSHFPQQSLVMQVHLKEVVVKLLNVFPAHCSATFGEPTVFNVTVQPL